MGIFYLQRMCRSLNLGKYYNSSQCSNQEGAGVYWLSGQPSQTTFMEIIYLMIIEEKKIHYLLYKTCKYKL